MDIHLDSTLHCANPTDSHQFHSTQDLIDISCGLVLENDSPIKFYARGHNLGIEAELGRDGSPAARSSPSWGGLHNSLSGFDKSQASRSSVWLPSISSFCAFWVSRRLRNRDMRSFHDRHRSRLITNRKSTILRFPSATWHFVISPRSTHFLIPLSMPIDPLISPLYLCVPAC